ncbi:uncharacterized protein LAESUDRAFT_711102 [Laetiporus sulphureus 93-53]|uniref:GDP/GTP exchange factor Sec2 N-terminal domain-containing protein n=1 Tax=Laetiporus sulphureus 93-53 TaxID=1314785 RepID=A0A165GN97_9APHY|nr:uncharacterized protein LAESUDRAFT_711102 [Laetiporus sulphureus 93-53]KZT10581.1 hypothetical protein LAESUDRAFT_711102 [Laetiporus sulphureus 93-53]
MPPSDDRGGLPRRVDSFIASKMPFFTQLDDELRDVKRVHSQGQEEDLRMALGRMISRVEELTSMLKEAFKAQTDLQTELTLAKSNLQLALANNEMLEDALKREGGGHLKDIGWRRWSAKEQKERLAEEERRRSVESSGSCDTAQNSPVLQPPSRPASPLPSAARAISPAPSSEGRFFRFRFGSGGSATSSQFPSSPRVPIASGNQSPLVNGHAQSASSHLTSASLPSLVPARDWEKEVEQLNADLKHERESRKAVVAQKEALEAELESLSQALFEEANNMVSVERRKLAETEDELKELHAEREALRNALRLLERQTRVPETVHSMDEAVLGHAHAGSISSSRAVKSLPSSRAATPDSARRVDEDPTSAGTVVPHRPPPLPILDPDSPLVSPSPSPVDTIQHTDEPDEHKEAQPAEESSASSVEPSPSPSPSVESPEVGDYVYPLMRTADYLPGEPSPWADAKSVAVASTNPA